MNDLKKKTTSGFVYKFAERAGAQGISFVISMVLARLLLPQEYGIIALVTVFITICDVFVTYGFGSSLIANKDSDSLDFSTCFYFGLALAIVLYIIVYFTAPLLADFYGNEILTPVIRVMGLRIPLAAVNSVQHSYVSKHMIFKKFFYATIIGTIISGIAAVIMAYMGCGVWALVEQYLGNVCIDTICLFLICEWKPTLEFSWESLKKIYSYGWKILAVGLIDTGYTELRSLVIGKKYTSEDLAYYNKGNQFPKFGMKLVEPTVNSVLFPALSNCQDNREQMRSISRRIIKVSTYIIFPVMIGLAVVAKPLIIVVLSEKWLDCVIYLQIGCIANLFRPLQFINNSIIKGSGRSSLLLKLDIIKKLLGIFFLLISMGYGVMWIAISLVVTNMISTMINITPNRKLLNYGYKTQLMDVLPNFCLAILMGIIVYPVSLIRISPFIILVLQSILGVIIYLGLSKMLKVDSYTYAKKEIRSFILKFKKKRSGVGNEG